MSPRTGRRAGDSGTRGHILNAARAAFTANGYHRATIRDIAKHAKVDPALVHHYFGTKQQLFVAAVEMPVNPADLIAAALADGRDTAGLRLAETFLSVWDTQGNRNPMIALIRSATSHPEAATMVREFISDVVFERVTSVLGASDPELRASLVGSQMMGIALLRYVIGLEPLASLPAQDLAGIVAPTLQRYITGEL